MLDRYQLRRELHAGGAGEVWLARERDTREIVVARLGLGPIRAERVRREGVALGRLSHPSVPRLIDQGEVDGGWCVIVEYIEGALLSKVLKVTNPSPPRAVGWARQIAHGVAHLHTAGIVHGDLHPGNVLIGRDAVGRDRLVLVGFGVCTVDGVPPGAPPRVHNTAPEVARGETATPSTDVYGIGAMLYRMLVERWPFHGSDQQVLAAQLETPPPPLGRHVPHLRLPPGLEDLVFRCLAKVPEDRFASVDEVVEALSAVEFLPQRDWVRVGGSVAPALERAVHDSRAEPPEPRWGVAAMVGLGLGGLVALGWLLTRL